MKTLASRVSLVVCLFKFGCARLLRIEAAIRTASAFGNAIARRRERWTYARALTCACMLLWMLSTVAPAQSREHGRRGEHLIAIVPIVGAGTPSDPRRPLFVPNPQDVSTAITSGQEPSFLDIHFVMADDGMNAIVEFVAKDRAALKPIIAAGKASTAQVFDPRTLSQADTAVQLRKFKADFEFNALRGIRTFPSSTSAAPAGGSN